MHTYDVIEEFTEKEFEELLDICFENATFFALTRELSVKKENYDEKDTFAMDLSKYEITSYKTKKWFGYNFGDQVGPTFKVYVYKSNQYAKEAIRKHTKDLLLHDVTKTPFTLENLCFFKDKTLFLGTVSHAGICRVYPFDLTIEKKITSLGTWSKYEYSDNYQFELTEDFKF